MPARHNPPRSRRSHSLAVAALVLLGTPQAAAQSERPNLMSLLRGAPAGSAEPAAPATARRFYVRADFSAGLNWDTDQTSANCGAAPIIELCGYSVRARAGAAFGGTIGLGYRWTSWLRTDATFTYRRGEQGAGSIDLFNGQPATGIVAARMSAATLMLNVYVDVIPALGLDQGWLQPYIGAGFGPSFNHVGDSVVSGALPSGFASARLDSATTSDLAWNAGGGVAIRLAESIAIDIGYRYVALGTFRTGSGVTAPTVIAVDRLQANARLHEVYLGFRLSFD